MDMQLLRMVLEQVKILQQAKKQLIINLNIGNGRSLYVYEDLNNRATCNTLHM